MILKQILTRFPATFIVYYILALNPLPLPASIPHCNQSCIIQCNLNVLTVLIWIHQHNISPVVNKSVIFFCELASLFQKPKDGMINYA